MRVRPCRNPVRGGGLLCYTPYSTCANCHGSFFFLVLYGTYYAATGYDMSSRIKCLYGYTLRVGNTMLQKYGSGRLTGIWASTSSRSHEWAGIDHDLNIFSQILRTLYKF
jgi:hypothetical protein